jgi:two-component system phosphate regulon response regulator PhoB
MKKILVIEDERDIAELLTFNLEKEGFTVCCTHDGISGLELARREDPDLIVLDLMLPGMMGTDICRELRRDPALAMKPVLMLTARGEEIDRVVGFEVGADDYLTKPFSMRELLLRIRAVLRRAEHALAPTGSEVVTLGDIVIETERHRVESAGSEVALTSTEFKLLLYLAERPGRVFSRELLLQNVWGYNSMADTRTVDTHVTRLRSKLGKAGECIRTVRGFGYKIEI